MLIPLEYLIKKYNINFQGILHIGAHECEELPEYEKYLSRDKILWVEAIPEKVNGARAKYPGVLIEQAVVSDQREQVKFNITNNGQSSSMLELGLHQIFYPGIVYVSSFTTESKRLEQVIEPYSNIHFNFLNLDIQGAELKALKGMGDYLKKVDYIYAEVNIDYLYQGCALLPDIDQYLAQFGFKRVEQAIYQQLRWGDAFYIKIK